MSISVTSTNLNATAQAKDKRDALTLALVLVVICLGNLALVLASENSCTDGRTYWPAFLGHRSSKTHRRGPLSHGGPFPFPLPVMRRWR